MKARDQEALKDIVAGIDRALGFPITDFDSFEQTDYLQDALIRCLEVMGEAVKRLSPLPGVNYVGGRQGHDTTTVFGDPSRTHSARADRP